LESFIDEASAFTANAAWSRREMENIRRVAVLLASDDANYMLGASMFVDAG
jgi:hypothetical protein